MQEAKLKVDAEFNSTNGAGRIEEGEVVTVLGEARRIPPVFDTLLIGITSTGGWVVLTSDNCEAVTRAVE